MLGEYEQLGGNRTMKSFIIGAGRGSRLKALSDHQPKCYAAVGERPILDWILEAFNGAGLDAHVFIGGYRIEQIRRDYPELTYCRNDNWENNNILASLFYAEQHMDEGFVCSYADILFRDSVVKRALDHPGDIVLCVDTGWKARYVDRLQHPADDAEKVIADGDRVTRIHRAIPVDEAVGEYIGVAKFSPRGASLLRDYYHRAHREFGGQPWRDAARFEVAYLIELFQEMIEQGVPVHLVTTDGDYMEIDTEEDYRLANEKWVKTFAG
jgi:choline kinase